MSKSNLKKRISKIENEIDPSTNEEVIKIKSWGLGKRSNDKDGYGEIKVIVKKNHRSKKKR